jgi:hypothetical protein
MEDDIRLNLKKWSEDLCNVLLLARAQRAAGNKLMEILDHMDSGWTSNDILWIELLDLFEKQQREPR